MSAFAPLHSPTRSPLRKRRNSGTTRTPHSFIKARDSKSVSPMIFTNVTFGNSCESPTKVG